MFLRSHVASPIRRYRPSIHAHELRSSPSKEGEYQRVVHAALVTSSTELHSSNKESLCVECASVRPVPNYTSALSGPSKTLCTLGTKARHFVTCEDGHCSTRWEVVLESRDADIAPSLANFANGYTRRQAPILAHEQLLSSPRSAPIDAPADACCTVLGECSCPGCGTASPVGLRVCFSRRTPQEVPVLMREERGQETHARSAGGCRACG